MSVAIEATETTVSALLDSIERGDEVELQKNGKTIAILVPSVDPHASAGPNAIRRTPEQIAAARAALADIDDLSARLGLKFDFDEFKADKEFGRR